VTYAQQPTTLSAWARTPPTWRPSSTGPARTTHAHHAAAGQQQQEGCCSGVWCELELWGGYLWTGLLTSKVALLYKEVVFGCVWGGTRRHVCSHQECHCLPGEEPTAKDRVGAALRDKCRRVANPVGVCGRSRQGQDECPTLCCAVLCCVLWRAINTHLLLLLQVWCMRERVL
jgi:hypothetical protein